MAHQQVKDILESIRQTHRVFRHEVEQAWGTASDPRSRFLLRSIRRSEQEMDLALAKYKKDGHAAVLETWIQYVPSEDLEEVVNSGLLSPVATPDEVIARKQRFDSSLAEFYQQLANQVSASRVHDLIESLASQTDQQVADRTWKARDQDLAPDHDD